MLLYRDYVVVDQGGHTECESLAAFSKLWPKLTNGGRITLRIYQVLKHVAILNQPIPSSTIIDDPSHQPCVPTAECYPTLLLTHCCCILSHISEQEKEKWQMKIFGQSLAHHQYFFLAHEYYFMYNSQFPSDAIAVHQTSVYASCHPKKVFP